MQSFEEATNDLMLAAEEFLKQLAASPNTKKMPKDLPPIARRLWRQCKKLQSELLSSEFDSELKW